MPTFEYTAPDGSVYEFDGDENSARSAFGSLGSKQPAQPNALFSNSFTSGIAKGLINAMSASGQAAAIEQGEDPSSVPNAQQGREVVEKNITGPLYDPTTFWGKVAGGAGEALGNPASYIGPGGLAKIVGAGVGGAGSEIAGQLLPDNPWLQVLGRLGGGFLGGTAGAGSELALERGLSKLGNEAGAVAVPGVGSGGPTAPPPNPLEAFDPMAVQKVARAAQASRNLQNQPLTPADVAAKSQQLGPEGFLSEQSRNLQAQSAGLANTPGTGMDIVYNAVENRSRMQARSARLEQAVTDAMGPRVNIENLNAQNTQAQSAAANPAYRTWRNTQVPVTPELNTFLTRMQGSAAGTSIIRQAEDNIRFEGQQPYQPDGAPSAGLWDQIKQELDARYSTALRNEDGGAQYRINGARTDLLNALDNHPQVAGIYRTARDAYAGPAAVDAARELGQRLFNQNVDQDVFANRWAGMAAPERTALLQGARSNVSNLMDATSNGDRIAARRLLAPASQAKLSQVIGPDKTQGLAQAAEREQGFSAHQNTVTGNSMTGLRTAAKEDIATPETPLGEEHLLPAVSTKMWLYPAAGIHQRYLDWRYPQMREDMARMHVTQGPQAGDLMNALLAHPMPPNPFAQGAGYAAAPSIINALMNGAP
jgi:hypothetical protein